MRRCCWVDEKSEIYKKYHDEEWGVPKYDDRDLFELLVLESFQAGLSWLTILNKREAFRQAFDNFDVKKVAAYPPQKISELLNNPGIVRHRGKIEAAIGNARVFLAVQKEFGSFAAYVWHFSGGKVIKRQGGKIPASTPLSEQISYDLRRRGMKYAGPVTVYAYLQAAGIVNDHEEGCFKY